MPPKHALISSYFAPKTGFGTGLQEGSSSSSTNTSETRSQKDTSSSHGRKRASLGGDQSQQARTSASGQSGAKHRRTGDSNGEPGAAAPAKGSQSSRSLEQWRFDRQGAKEALAARSQHSALVHTNSDGNGDDLHSLQSSQGLPRTAEQEARHAAFSQRLLGTLHAHAERREKLRKDDIDGARGLGSEDANADGADSEIDGQDEDAADKSANVFEEFSAQPEAPKGRILKTKAGTSKQTVDANTKYTPLERQYLELREAHPGIILCIEVGYKYKFYDDDARVASRELNIACFLEKHLFTAMIPLHRLNVHIKKLIAAGYKVGIVRQTETRALKKASNNASKPFTREMTELFTASTWIDDISEVDREASRQGTPRSLIAIVEKSEGGESGAEERVSLGLVAVQATTGSIVFDQFTDESMRSELETRLAHLEPVELIIPLGISRQTKRLLRYVASQATHGATSIRVEHINRTPTYNEAFEAVNKFYASQGPAEAPNQETESFDTFAVLQTVGVLPTLAIQALDIAIKHMSEFKLESVFRIATNFTSFASRNEMLLTSNTLSNLEVLENNTDYREKGSLMWMLGANSLTTMGRRLLRRWVARPLTNPEKLAERSDGVQSLAQGQDASLVPKLTAMLRGLPDLEKGLARLNYGRATPNELATILLSLNRVTSEYKGEMGNIGKSQIVAEAVATLPKGRKTITEALALIDIREARENNKRNLFKDRDLFPDVQDTKELIQVVESELHEHLLDVRKIVKNPRLAYASVAGEEYLIEVLRTTKVQIPPTWLRINSTKKVLRYRSPRVMQLTAERDRLSETLDAQCDMAFQSFVRQLCDKHYSLLRGIIISLSTLDALMSLVATALLPGYSRAEIVEAQDPGGIIELEAFRHPMSETLHESPYVANDIALGDATSDQAQGILLTGSNMGGKSSTVRAIALVIIMAQIGSFVPAKRARLSLHDAVLTRMGASDQLAKGRSTMMVEVQETAEILRTASHKSLVILDELGRGTSTHDGAALAHAVLVHLLTRDDARRPTLLFVTHFLSLAGLCSRLQIRGMHMAYIDHGNNDITFLYKVRDGFAEKSFGIYCARLAGLPLGILELAARKAKELEDETVRRTQARQQAHATQVVRHVFGADHDSDLAVAAIQLAGRVYGLDT